MGTIEIRAASRLHFGLLAPSQGHVRRFGGIGVMIETPFVELSLTPADHFTVVGPGRDRVLNFAETWMSASEQVSLPACLITVHALPPLHAGLGVGTQLGLSVGRLLDELLGGPFQVPLSWLVESVEALDPRLARTGSFRVG